MKTFKQNITTIFGKAGTDWINHLPAIIKQLSMDWQLKHIEPVPNMTFNYVAKAVHGINQPVVLKISYDEKSLANEIQALKYFDCKGAIQLLAHHAKFHALLLECACPGVTLKSLYQDQTQIDYVMDAYIAVMDELHSKRLPMKHHFPHIKTWLMAIDKLSAQLVPEPLLQKAQSVKNSLLSSMRNEVFLHGDLHHDNILKHGDHWLAIDPKGVVGERAFEIAAFDFMYIHELSNSEQAKMNFVARIHLLAEKAKLDPERLQQWVFVRLMLMAAWLIEDKGDATFVIKLAEMIAVTSL